MRKHVAPADPSATVPDPERGRALPPEGLPVDWSPYWAGLALRGDIVVTDPPSEPDDAGPPAPRKSSNNKAA